MELRVLGPLEAFRGGRRLHLSRRQQRLVLGILALEANKLVTSDRLIELMWGQSPPQRARANIQTRISELRSALQVSDSTPDDVELISHANGYMLRLPPDSVDAHRFRRLVAVAHESTDDAARDALREALSLWRGPILGADATTIEIHSSLCHGLELARLAAAEQLFELELRRGNHPGVLDELTEMASANPTRERLTAQLVEALHRSGRTAEALRTYERWRRWLADELGVDPSKEMQEVHRAILQDTAALGNAAYSAAMDRGVDGPGDPDQRLALAGADVPGATFQPPVPRLLPADIPDFTGRAPEVAEMRRLLSSHREYQPATVALVGRGGIGKTALSVHVAHLVRHQYPDGQLFINLHGFDDEAPVAPADVLGRFLQALGVNGSAIPDGLDERVELYRDLLADRRVLIVLDNADSDAQLLPLIPGGPACGLIVTSRARLGPALGMQALDLAVLNPSGAQELLALIAGQSRIASEPAAAAELCRECGHLPLAIRIVGAKLAAKPHWAVSRMLRHLRQEGRTLDHLTHGHLDVRASIAMSYRDLPHDVQRLLRVLGEIAASEVPVWLAAAALDAPGSETELLLEHLVDAQLLDPATSDHLTDVRYRLHDLVRLFAAEQAAAEDDAQARSAARHRAYGAWLTVADAAYRAVFGGDVLHVGGVGRRVAVDDRILERLRDRPLEWFDTERAGVVATIRQAARLGDAAVCWDLAITTSPLFELRRYFDDWHGNLELAQSAARESGDLVGQAAVLHRFGMLRTDRQQTAEARETFQRAHDLFRTAGHDHGEAIARAYMAMADRFLGRPEQALDSYQAAMWSFVEVGDPGGEVFALRGIGQLHLARGEFDLADDYFERALHLCHTNGLRLAAAQTLFWQGSMRSKQGRLDEAASSFAHVLSVSRELGDRTGECQALRGLGLCYRLTGRQEEARAVLKQAMRLAHQPRETMLQAAIRRDLEELDRSSS